VDEPGYDRMNNKLLEEKTHDTDNSEVYDYDSTYRVTSFDRGTLSSDKTSISTVTDTPNQLQSQTWDLNGANNWNSTDHTTGGTTNTESRKHTDYNEIEEVSGEPYGEEKTGTHVLDDNGNITDDNRREMIYDAFNRITEVKRKSDDRTVAHYTYDSMNRRFRKVADKDGVGGQASTGTRITEYFYKDWQVLEERDDSDNLQRQYVYGRYIDEPLTLDDRGDGQTVADLNDGSGDDRVFYHCNTQYSTHALTDETGSIVEAYQYDAYGRPTVFTDPGSDGTWFTDDDTQQMEGESDLANKYFFQGRRFDEETQMQYFRNRYYNSRLGRFISRDPMGVWYDIMARGNSYTSFGSNPLSILDSEGYGVGPNPKNIIRPRKAVRRMGKATRDSGNMLASISLEFPIGRDSNRFVWTCKYGWIDLAHLANTALTAFYTSEETSYDYSVAYEEKQLNALLWANKLGRAPTPHGQSAYTVEDLKSNYHGATLGDEYAQKSWSKHGSEAFIILINLMSNFFRDAGAVDSFGKEICCCDEFDEKMTVKEILSESVRNKWTSGFYTGPRAYTYHASVKKRKEDIAYKCLCDGEQPKSGLDY
jgi:RHS repeat-associated protein